MSSATMTLAVAARKHHCDPRTLKRRLVEAGYAVPKVGRGKSPRVRLADLERLLAAETAAPEVEKLEVPAEPGDEQRIRGAAEVADALTGKGRKRAA